MDFDRVYGENLYEIFSCKIDEAFNFLSNKHFDYHFLQESLQELESLTPDSENYPETQGVLAQNAIIALCYCYDYMITNDSEMIYHSLGKLYETIDSSMKVMACVIMIWR